MTSVFENKISIKLASSFYKKEYRCDYEVSEKTKKIMAVELDLLSQMERVCSKYDIKYFAYAGTMLGAVRHKGFIPWDDDIDVAMTRENFDKFLKVAPAEFNSPYFFQTALTDRRYFFSYARLRNSLTSGLILKQATPDYNNGIYIDIFVLDGLTENDSKLQKQLKWKSFLTRLANAYRKENIQESSFFFRIIKYVLHYSLCTLLPYEKFVELFNKNLSKYNESSDKLTILTHKYEFLKKYWCYKKDCESIVLMPFESLMIPVPKNYDAILTNMYGDYMEYPPIEKRGAWHEGILKFDPDVSYIDLLNRKNS